MSEAKKRLLALLASMALAVVLALSACTGNAASSSGASDGASSASASASSSAQADSLFGKPWVTSEVSGNLPAEAPSVKDDLYMHYNFDYLATHQGEDEMYIASSTKELQDATVAAVKDTSRDSLELRQMRIFFDQALDTEKLAAIGFSEVQPFIDRIDAVRSIDEMNALLASSDFPFNPFITAFLSASDTRGVTGVGVCPNYVYSNALIDGGKYYQDDEGSSTMLFLMGMMQLIDADLLNLSEEDAAKLLFNLVEFEKSYGKYDDYDTKYVKVDYGEYAKAVAESTFTLDELRALAPNMPLKEMLEKCQKAHASEYRITPEWLSALNGLWTDANLDLIKLAAKCKVLIETRPYRDQSGVAALLEMAGEEVPDAETLAFGACDSIDTFAELIAKTYVDDVLGDQAKARLGALTQHLIDTYREIIPKTPWLDDESEQLLLEKLDHMTLNVLEPAGGYYDYSGVQLVPSEEGGTLLSNYFRLKQYRYDYESKLIGQPATADTVWHAVKPTEFNAFYDPTDNAISIFPGFVVSTVYRNDMADAELLGGIGFTIGHEISHSFDFMGSQIDAYGQGNPVLTEQDIETFLAECAELSAYYNAIEYMPGEFVDGQLVISEAAADLCGLQACAELAGKSKGFDYDQFFAQVAKTWAEVMTKELFTLTASFDPHPIPNLRVNVNAQMVDALYDALGVSEGDGMFLAPGDRLVIWGPQA